MKTKHIILIISAILIAQTTAYAQQNWETDGNFIFSGDFLGTMNIQDLRFRVNNQERLRLLTSNGFLALGSSAFTPSAHLHANLLSISTITGNLFRTDGHQDQTLTWSMFSGTAVANSALKARLFLSPTTSTQTGAFLTGMTNDARNHLVLESTRGDVVINAAGASENGVPGVLTERLRVTSDYITDAHWGANPVSATRVGISGRPGPLSIREPLAMLHIGDQ